MSHVCTVCFLDSPHREDCDACGRRHWPAPCCEGCRCGSFEDAHPTIEKLRRIDDALALAGLDDYLANLAEPPA